MIYEFEGKTEKEAIDRAAEELGLEKDEFDVEIVESQKNGFLFKKGWVKIRVHVEGDAPRPGLLAGKPLGQSAPAQGREERSGDKERPDREHSHDRPAKDHSPAEIEKFEADMTAFVTNV